MTQSKVIKTHVLHELCRIIILAKLSTNKIYILNL